MAERLVDVEKARGSNPLPPTVVDFNLRLAMKILNILIFTFILLLFFLSVFSLRVDIKSSLAQANKYTIFKTENEGFKFYKIFNNQKFLAPLFAQTPTTTSDKNQLATKEYVDNLIIENISYYEGERCFYPEKQIVIGGSDRDFPIIGGDPRQIIDQRGFVVIDRQVTNEHSRFLNVDRNNFIRKYPIGIVNSKWVACLNVDNNPAIGYVVVPEISQTTGDPEAKPGSCEATEDYDERSKGYNRYMFDERCSWSLKKWCSSCSITGKGNFDFLSKLYLLQAQGKIKIKSFSLDLYTNDSGYCLARFLTDADITLEAKIKKASGKGYPLVGPVTITTDKIDGQGNFTKKIIFERSSNRDTSSTTVTLFKPSYLSFRGDQFWKSLVTKIEIEGWTYNSVQLGVNICKLVLWFE